MRTTLISHVLALAGLAAGLAIPRGAVQAGTITGLVVVESTDAMVADAAVTIFDAAGRVTSRSANADASGRFLIQGVPAGRYYLSATKSPFVTSEFGANKPERIGTPIVVTAGQTVSDLRVSMFRGAVVSGTVWAPDGTPVPKASVSAIRQRILPGGGRLASILAQATTDDRGQYRVFGLPPGDFLIRTVPTPRGSVQIQPGRSRVMAATFAPGTDQAGRATLVRLEAAEERLNVDIRLAPVATADLAGVVRAVPGIDLKGRSIRLTAVPADDAWASGGLWTAAVFDGAFTLQELPLGRYQVTAASFGTAAEMAAGTGLIGQAIVSVTSTTPPPLDVVVQTATLIAGRVEFHLLRGWPQPDATTVRVALRSADVTDSASTRGQSPVAGDGSFALRGILPGRYLVEMRSVARGRSQLAWRVQRVRLDDRDLAEPILEIGYGRTSHLQIALADDTATLTGSLTRDATVQTPAPFIVLVPVKLVDALEIPVGLAARPATDGVFNFFGVRAGDYAVAIVDDIHPDDLNDPEALARLKAASTLTLTFTRGENKRVDLKKNQPVTVRVPGR